LCRISRPSRTDTDTNAGTTTDKEKTADKVTEFNQKSIQAGLTDSKMTGEVQSKTQISPITDGLLP
jgi:hypothetical protein